MTSVLSRRAHGPLFPIASTKMTSCFTTFVNVFFLSLSLALCHPRRSSSAVTRRKGRRETSFMLAKTLCRSRVRVFLQLLGVRGTPRIRGRAISCLLTHNRGTRPAAITRLYPGKKRGRDRGGHIPGWRGDRKARNGLHCDDRRRDTIDSDSVTGGLPPAVPTDVKWSFKNIVAPDV